MSNPVRSFGISSVSTRLPVDLLGDAVDLRKTYARRAKSGRTTAQCYEGRTGKNRWLKEQPVVEWAALFDAMRRWVLLPFNGPWSS